MLRLFVSASALALIGGIAAAADLPPPMQPAPSPMYAPTPIAYNWSGFYVGAHGGWGFGTGAFDDGFVIGGQVGVNAQWNNFVLGAEGDGSFVDWGGADAVGTARLRGGFAFDRFLVYGTGGVAFQDFSDAGWVVGGGGEYALTDNVSVGVEFLHYDFGSDDSDVVRGRVNVKFNSLFGG
jgi:outer membrane immunogenic protein